MKRSRYFSFFQVENKLSRKNIFHRSKRHNHHLLRIVFSNFPRDISSLDSKFIYLRVIYPRFFEYNSSFLKNSVQKISSTGERMRHFVPYFFRILLQHLKRRPWTINDRPLDAILGESRVIEFNFSPVSHIRVQEVNFI